MKNILICLMAMNCAGCAGYESAEQETSTELKQTVSPSSFQVEFDACTEFAGIGFVPMNSAQELLPSGYELQLFDGEAAVVVRAVECAEIAVDGKKSRPGRLSQIGLMVSGLDTSADINNYTLWYVTNNSTLHAKLRAAGIDSVMQPSLSYEVASEGGEDTLTIESSSPQVPAYVASGPVSISGLDPSVFVATWWAEGRHGRVRTRTVFPEISFTFDGSITLSTPANSDLAGLIGGTTLNFPLLNSYNSFAHAEMLVTVN